MWLKNTKETQQTLKKEQRQQEGKENQKQVIGRVRISYFY